MERPALLCQERMRALALIDQHSGLGDIARHPEAGLDCRICEHGAGAYRPVSKTVAGLSVRRGFESPLRYGPSFLRVAADSGRLPSLAGAKLVPLATA